MSPDTTNKMAALVRRVPRWAWIVTAVALVFVVALGVAAYVTSQPAFLGKYHLLERSYTTLEKSSHAGLACAQCHVDRRGPVVYEATLIGEFYRGLVRKPKEPSFVRLSTPTNAACLRCHNEDWSHDAKRTGRVPHPAHLRVANEKRECVTCHKWTAHEEEYVERHKEMPFSTVCASFGCHVGWKTKEQCGSCHHSLQEGKGEWKDIHPETVRAFGPNGCLESCHDAGQCRQCHTTGKKPDFGVGALSGSVKAIEREHVKKDWISKHGVLGLQDQKKCLECHVSIAECQDCHSRRPAFHGPESTWLTRHKEFAKDERRCLICHKKPWCEECHKQFKEMR